MKEPDTGAMAKNPYKKEIGDETKTPYKRIFGNKAIPPNKKEIWRQSNNSV